MMSAPKYLVVALSIFSGCGGGTRWIAEPPLEVEWSGDTTPIAAAPVGEGFARRVLPVLRIGASERGSNDEFGHIAGIAIDGQRHTYVLERGAGIAVFDTLGELVVRFGPRGSGPGELTSPRDLAVGGDTVFVLDDCIKMFSTNGEYIGAFGDKHQLIRSHRMQYSTAGLAVYTYRFAANRRAEFIDSLEIRFLSPAPGRKASAVHTVAMKSYRLAKTAIEGAAVLDRHPSIGVAPDGGVYVTDPQALSILRYSADGRPHTWFRGQVPRVRTTRSDFNDDRSAATVGAGPSGSSWVDAMSKAPRARYRPVTGHILLSNDGDMLFERPDLSERPYNRTDPEARSIWQIAAQDGSARGYLELRTRFLPMWFDGRHVIGMELNDDDAQTVVHYRIADR